MTGDLVGALLGGRYRIAARIGGGGSAIVYRAHDELLGRTVALKVLYPQSASDEEFVRRFRREAQAAAALGHPNIVSIYDVGADGDLHYIVMEYVAGRTLKELIKRRGRLPLDWALAIAVEICEALAHAHRHRTVHRDIKPHNILITPDGRVKVTDFGIARATSAATVTQPGTIMGSVYYFSPEQARGRPTSERSDLYSLGVVLYEMVTGRVPFSGEGPITIALKHVQEPVRPPREHVPNLPREVERIILRALRKPVRERYQSAEEMKADLEAALAGLESQGLGPSATALGDGAPWDAPAPPAGTRTGGGPAAGGSGGESGPGGPASGGSGEYPAGGAGAGGSRIPGGVATTGDQPDPDSAGAPLTGDEEDEAVPRIPTTRVGEGPANGGWAGPGHAGKPGTGRRGPARRGVRRVLAVTLVLLLLLGGGAWAGFRYVMAWLEVPEVAVPDVVGLPVVQAASVLERSGLTHRVVGQQYSDQYPVGAVVWQNPAPPEVVKTGRTIELVLSNGPEMVAVPAVAGRPLTEAILLLEEAGLTNVQELETYHPKVPKGYVISQLPNPGLSVQKATVVRLEVSLGPEPVAVEVPQLEGLSIDGARQRLEALGLDVGEIRQSPDSRPAGTVVGSDPPAGATAASGTAVTLYVSTATGGGTTKQNTWTFQVPGEPTEERRVRATLAVDGGQESEVYDEAHRGGDVIRRVETWQGGRAVLRVYVDGRLHRTYDEWQ